LTAGGLLTTDTGLTGPTPEDPLQTTLVSPASGGAAISQPLDVSQPLPEGVPVMPAQNDIQAPLATAGIPLRLRFSFDATLLQTTGATASTVAVFRDGVQVGECTNPAVVAAAPDPCVYSRTSLPGGDAEVDVYSSHASHWNFGRKVTTPPTTFTITTVSLPSGTRGHAYSATLQAANGTPPYKWKKIGKLPKGLKLQAKTGVISGTPKVSGTFIVKVQVSDSKKPKPKHVATKTLTLQVL
jgi:hypothetical protein